MRCGVCGGNGLRLQGFSGGRECWACSDCGESTRLLDCDLCERRLVRRLAAPGHWACAQCSVTKVCCPRCQKRWLGPGGRCPDCGDAMDA